MCTHLGRLMLRQGWAEAKSKLGKLMYKGRYSCLYRRESTTRWGDVYHERPVHGHKAVHHVTRYSEAGRSSWSAGSKRVAVRVQRDTSQDG